MLYCHARTRRTWSPGCFWPSASRETSRTSFPPRVCLYVCVCVCLFFDQMKISFLLNFKIHDKIWQNVLGLR
jgi:hypothetical protein